MAPVALKRNRRYSTAADGGEEGGGGGGHVPVRGTDTRVRASQNEAIHI